MDAESERPDIARQEANNQQAMFDKENVRLLLSLRHRIELGPQYKPSKEVGPKGTAPSGAGGYGDVRNRALKHPANQIFAPSGRALGSLPGCLVATRTKLQSTNVAESDTRSHT